MKTASSIWPIRVLLSALTASLALIGGITVRTFAADCSPPPASLVGWWRGDGSGDDAAGNNHGTVVGATFVGGEVGEALSFNGTGQKVTIPDNDALKLTNSLTIEGWIFPRANGFLLFRGDSRPGLDPYALTIELTHELQFIVCNDANEAMFLRTPGAVPMNQWLHVAATLDGATGDVRLYVNGSLAAQTNTTIRPLRDLDSNYGAGFAIGGHAGSYNYFSFDGMIDELSLYNRALATNEIAAIYQAGSAGKCTTSVTADCVPPATGLVGWWRGEGNASDAAQTNQGTLAGGVSYVAGEVGQSFSFNSSNAAVRIPASAPLDVGNGAGLTVEAWIKPTDVAGAYPLFEWNDGNYWGVHFYIAPGQPTDGSPGPAGPGQLYANVVDSFGDWHQLGSSAGVVAPGVFQHVALTYDRTSGVAKIYRNGEVVSQLGIGSFALRTAYDLYLGRRQAPADEAGSFAGLMDEPSVYNRALSPDEITAIYHAGSAGKCTTPVTSDCVAPPAGLAGWWRGEGSGTDVVSGNNGTLSPSGASYATGLVGQAFRFDGTNGYLQIPDAPALKPANVTAEAWVWLDPALPPARGGEQIVFKKNTWTAWFEGYSLLKVTIDNGDGTYSDRFQFCVSRTGSQVAINSTTIAQRGKWYHVAATYDGNKSTLYVNGVAEATATPGFALDYGTDPIYIGTSGTWAPYLSMFGGIIDEPSIYGRALGADEIAVNYHAGSAGKCASAPPLAGPPVITDFSPKSGTNGSVVTLTGANFSPVAASNIVYFGAVRAVVTAASTTSLTVSLPVGATFAPPTVTVGGLTAYARASFMPTFIGGGSITSSNFAPRVDIANPIGAHRTVIADLDGDGKPDLIVSGGVQHGISIYRNISTAGTLDASSFAPRVDILTLPVADSPWDLVAADVDGDGKLDLLEANRGGNIVSILRNISTPGSLTANSFAPSVDLPVGDLPLGIVVRDLDGDGRADVAVGNFNSGNIAVFRNIGAAGSLSTNSFAEPVYFTTEAGTHSLCALDLDGDGKPDLAAVNANANSVSILRNTSTPGTIDANSFAPQFSLATPEYTHFVRAADIDGDGKPDLLITSVHGYALSVFRNLASPGTLNASSFAARVDFPLAGRGHTLSLGDLNGDNKLDVVVDTEINDALSIFQNLSTPGSFSTASLGPRVDLGTGYNAWGSSVGDLDGDGRPDIVFANTYDNTISLYRNVTATPAPPKITQEPPKETTVATGTRVTFTVVATGTAPLSYQWFFKQLAIGGATNATYVIPSATITNAGSYQVRVTNPFGIAWSQGNLLTVLPAPKVPVITEFSPKSGVPGSIVSLIGSNFSTLATSNIVYFGAERATVILVSATTLRVTVPVGATYAPPSVTVAGLTGAARNSFTPTFAGNGLLTAANFGARVNLTPGTGPTATVIADFDGDGKPDLAVSDGTSHTISVFRNISARLTPLTASSFGPRVVLPGTGSSGNSPYMLVAADVTGDGKLDLIATDLDANSVSVFRNLANPGALTTNSFAPRVAFAVGSSPRDVVVRDIDGDGKPEIVTANYNSANVSVLKNVSSPSSLTSTSFLARVDFAAGSGAVGLVVADLDGDGKPDIATANSATTTLSLLRNIGSPGVIATNSFAPQVTLVAPSYPHFLRAADIDGDGKLDLLLTTYLGPESLSVYRSLSAPGTLNAGSFAPRVEFPLGARGHTISIGDLNGDTKPDVVVDCEIPDRLCLFQNLSTPGSFTSNSFAARVDLPGGYNTWGSSVGDLDGDSRPDIAYANYYEGTISFAQNLTGVPRFLQQPLSQTVYVGDRVTFAASASGTSPLTYRWYYNGGLLDGATGSLLTLSNALLAQAGAYTVSVSNALGVVTSTNAVLTVLVPECITPPAGLVGWWPGEETSGDSVSTNSATIYGGDNYAAGKVGAGFEFKGYTNFARIPAAPALDVGGADGFTVEGWILPHDVAAFHPIWEWNGAEPGGTAIGPHLWIGRLPSSSGTLFANVVAADGSTHALWSADGVVVPEAWQHVALTYDKASGMARLLRNGEIVAEASVGSFTPKTGADVYLGRRPGDFPGDWTYNAWFDGVLDELSLYNRGLAPAEIRALYNARGEGKCALPPTVLAVTPPGAFVNEGQTVSFTALAVGTPALSYQWLSGSAAIPGATAATLTWSNVLYAQAGTYAVVVSNAAGSTLSSTVLLRVNRAPIADASASELLVISPNGSNAVVVLDGSRSSDPDGDALTYAWFPAGASVPIATGVVASPVLPVGSNALTLVVNDGMASGSRNLTVEVITVSTALERLIARVQTDVRRPNPLLASLRAALASIERHHPVVAILELEAFIRKVHVQLGRTDPALAAQLIAEARAIMEALRGCALPPTAPPLEITCIGHGHNGRPHLNIRGANNRAVIVETSTNLVDWEKVGVAKLCGDCAYEFDDAQTPAVGARYYRVVSPK